MSYRNKSFAVCDGCGVEEEVPLDSKQMPDDWTRATTDGEPRSKEFCAECFSEGYVAIVNTAIDRRKKRDAAGSSRDA